MQSHRNKLLIISYAYPPSSSPGAVRMSRLARRLMTLDWDPHALTVGAAVLQRSSGAADPLAHLPKQVRRVDDPLAKAAEFSTVTAHTATGGKKGRLKSLAAMMLFPDRTILWALRALREVRWCKELAPDVVLSTSPSLSSHLAGWWLSRQTGAKWVAEFRDPVSWLPQKNATSTMKRWLLSWIERRIVGKADLTVVVSEAFAEYFRQRYVGRNIVSIPNGAEFDEAKLSQNIARRADHIATRTATSPLVLVHSGELYGGERDPKPLIAAAKLAQSRMYRPLKLQFVGADSHLAGIAAAALAASDIVDVVGPKSHTEAVSITNDADGLIALLHDDPIGRIGIMSKFFDYAATANPVLVVGERMASLSQMVEDHGMGAACEYADIEGMANWMVQLSDQPQRSAYDCLAVCRKWSADVMAKSYADQLSKLVK